MSLTPSGKGVLAGQELLALSDHVFAWEVPMRNDWPVPVRLLKIAFLLAWSASTAAFARSMVAQPNASGIASAVASERGAAQGGGSAGPAAQLTPAVDQNQALYLVRATLLTLNDANRSGNYTVLRDLAAPDFQAKNTAADLALHFADLRNRKLDLYAVATLAPQFSPAPAVDGNRRLHLTGFFPTRPLQINFDLTFQVVNGQWRLLAISVATPKAPATQSKANSTPRPFYGVRILSGTAGVRW